MRHGVRLETVWADPVGSPSCKPLAGSPSGRWMARRSTTNATARSRPHDAFLECGILAHGFLRLRCSECGHDKLLAFSCKRREFCPSCGARRMSQTAAHLVDHVVIPHVPVR